ncbi:MAG: alanine dehydrogenase [Chloroflexota bacterium]|nr:MAG: alanine dehydrogenase [Chloroflexota bacterium]
MNFGVPKEIRPFELRVGLTPAGVYGLTQAGHTVFVERDAGAAANFDDNEYRAVGAQVVYSPEEVWGRANVIAKVSRLETREYPLLNSKQTILSFLHLAVASRDLPHALQRAQVTAIAYEMIQTAEGHLPVLTPLSQVAGRHAPVIAGELLESARGGRGILLSGIPGVPPAAVVILGAGSLGANALRAFVGMGSQVTILDTRADRLEALCEQFNGRITTLFSTPYNLQRVLKFADVVIGAVLVPGQRAPVLITREMLRTMRKRAVLIDYAIDQGGCAETSRPTAHDSPTYVVENVIHYCVPNVTARIARTASHALTNAALPYLLEIGARGTAKALELDAALRHGAQVLNGTVTE